MRILSLAQVFLLLAAISAPISMTEVTGKWTGQAVLGTAGKTNPFVPDLKLKGSALSGIFCFGDCNQDTEPIQEAKINGDRISFSVVAHASDLPGIDL